MRHIVLAIFLALVASVIFFSIGTISLRGQSVTVAEIVYVSGIVKIKTSTVSDWVEAQEGMKVKEGDIIKTEANSTAELAFGEGLDNIINIFPNSQLVISKFEPGLLKLEEGRVFSLLKKLKKGSTFEVRTPTAVAGARGTGWGVDSFINGTLVQGFEEAVYVAGLDEKGEFLGLTDLNTGWKTSILKGEGPKEFLRLSDEETRFWRRWKKEALRHIQDYKKRKAGVSGSSKGREEKTEELEHRTKILERVERETTRTEEIKRDRRTQGGASQSEIIQRKDY